MKQRESGQVFGICGKVLTPSWLMKELIDTTPFFLPTKLHSLIIQMFILEILNKKCAHTFFLK